MSLARSALALAALLAAVLGCSQAVRPEVLRSWVGRPAAALEKDWGPPTREVPDGELRILIYEEVTKNTQRTFDSADPRGRTLGAYAAAQAAAQEAYRLPTVYVRSYLFWVNRGGTIVNSAVHQP
ncbi:MAG: hypothetical protein HY002_12495 [Candidatus Rokubacteria bacterium]|nr:hypothetical protein [Candidatus Rokubacteria bacterium]